MSDSSPENSPERPRREIVFTWADTVKDDVPTWVWNYGGKGRIALGNVAMLAGRPGAGKSTCARWMVAQLVNGTLPGEWLGKPVGVAYLAREEHVGYIVKPSLRAHGADLSRIAFPSVKVHHEGNTLETVVTTDDMHAFRDGCIKNGVRAVVVDPLMAMLGAKTDAHRNNEVRAQLEPWRQLAEDIDGVVIGVAHLNKGGSGDVVAAINGSSAFGEIARAVFGFTKDPQSADGERIMSQEKNSLGDEDLALRYRIDSTPITTSTGKTAGVGKFVILGDSARSVGDVLRENNRGRNEPTGGTDYDEIVDFLRTLIADGPVEANEIYSAGDAAGYSKDQLKRAKNKAGDIEADRPVNPGPWYWQKAGSREQQPSPTPEQVRSAPCEVEDVFTGSREQGAPSSRARTLPADGSESEVSEVVLGVLNTAVGVDVERILGSFSKKDQARLGLTLDTVQAAADKHVMEGAAMVDDAGKFWLSPSAAGAVA